eukprot:scaffold26636_cov153-Skeletonema_menzelii.AAC.9
MGTQSEAKAKSQLAENNSILTRKIIFYAFLATLIADTYASKAEVLNHLTLWSLILHMLYFELHLPSKSTLIQTLIRLFHGPSFCGSLALFNMYLWTLIANPSMEFDLAPEGRSTWLIYAREWNDVTRHLRFGWVECKQVNGDASGTYNVTVLSPEMYVLISKAIGVISCIVAFMAVVRPKLLN